LCVFRTGASFSADPERDEFILFGGEFYDGSKVKPLKKNNFSWIYTIIVFLQIDLHV
jgi:hypothetical protein